MHNRIKDYVLYILISFVVLLIPFAAMKLGISGEEFIKSLSFAVFTSLLFGYLIADSRGLWRKKKFWSFIAIGVLAHALAFWFIFARSVTLKPVWFALIGVPEMLILLAFKNMLFSGRIES